jgi:HK97 family phage prohead protease
MDNQLIRYWSTPVTVNSNTNTIDGLGLVFFDGSDGTKHQFKPGKFEALAPGAEIVKHRDDVVCCFNHDMASILGRESNGTLKLSKTIRGFAYETKLNPDDSQHQSIGAKVKRGDVPGSSAIFKPLAGSWKDGILQYTKILLVEIGPVTTPAMTGTISQSQGFDSISDAIYETQRRISQLK